MELMFASLLVLHVPGLYGEDSNGGGCSALHVREALSLQSLCGPITKVLKLSVPENNSVTQMTPQFIEASLCGGGCHNTRQSCVSTATKIRRVPVILSQCGLTTTGRCEKECTTLEVEEDTSCRCDCLDNQEKCQHKGHIFNRASCQCECQDQGPAKLCRDQGRVWNQETCTCACPPALVKHCSTGFYFDHNSTCSCLADVERSEGEGGREERVERSQDAGFIRQPGHMEVAIILSLAGIATVFFLIILSLLKNINKLRETVKTLSLMQLPRKKRYSDIVLLDSSLERTHPHSDERLKRSEDSSLTRNAATPPLPEEEVLFLQSQYSH